MGEEIDQGRRRFFRRQTSNVQRPPWVKADIAFTDLCSRCDACIKACETQIIHRGDGGFPEVHFAKDECTFCEKCVSACPEPIFDLSQTQPWKIKAEISSACLTQVGVWCQSCKDACEPRAISFVMAVGQVPKPQINLDACTGCGACVSPCPSDAIKVKAAE
jgi:ferredoxin-type protein NapF